MNLELDIEKYDEFQEAFIEEITKTVLTKLVEAGMEGQKLEETAANIVFSIASIIDDTTAIESDGNAVKPYLAFRTGDDELLHCGENSYTYEFVRIVLKKLLDV